MVDNTTKAALEAPVVYWRVLLYADFLDDVLRVTSGLYDLTLTGTGDSELDGRYDSYNHEVIEVGSVKHNEAGSDTVTISMSGLLVGTVLQTDEFGNYIYGDDGKPLTEVSSDFLNLIGDRTRWQGRTARLWFYCVDENESLIGSYIPYYTGYMNDVSIDGDPESQRVTLSIENYLVSLSGAANKTYLMQPVFDPDDLSGNATIAAGNGLQSAGSGLPAGAMVTAMQIWAGNKDVKRV